MYFLGQAANYNFKQMLGHTFARGKIDDYEELRAYLAARYGATKNHVALYHTGRSALATALKTLVPEGSDVIITGLTCYAVVQAVLAAKCNPVVADIDPETLHFGKPQLLKALEKCNAPGAVIVQNNLGIPADITGIEQVTKAFNLTLIEDLAHCAGIKYADGREAGTVGQAAVLSFGKGKSIDTISGGAVVFTSPDDPPARQPQKKPKTADRLRDRWYPFFGWLIRGFYRVGLGQALTAFLIKTHQIKRSADAKIELNTRLTFWQAKLALKQLKALSHRGMGELREHYFVRDRSATLKKLASHKFIMYDTWYDVIIAPARVYRKLDFDESTCPIAAEVAKTLVNLPTHYEKSEVLDPARNIIAEFQIHDIAEYLREKGIDTSDFEAAPGRARPSLVDEIAKEVSAPPAKLPERKSLAALKEEAMKEELAREEKTNAAQPVLEPEPVSEPEKPQEKPLFKAPAKKTNKLFSGRRSARAKKLASLTAEVEEQSKDYLDAISKDYPAKQEDLYEDIYTDPELNPAPEDAKEPVAEPAPESDQTELEQELAAAFSESDVAPEEEVAPEVEKPAPVPVAKKPAAPVAKKTAPIEKRTAPLPQPKPVSWSKKTEVPFETKLAKINRKSDPAERARRARSEMDTEVMRTAPKKKQAKPTERSVW